MPVRVLVLVAVVPWAMGSVGTCAACSWANVHRVLHAAADHDHDRDPAQQRGSDRYADLLLARPLRFGLILCPPQFGAPVTP